MYKKMSPLSKIISSLNLIKLISILQLIAFVQALLRKIFTFIAQIIGDFLGKWNDVTDNWGLTSYSFSSSVRPCFPGEIFPQDQSDKKVGRSKNECDGSYGFVSHLKPSGFQISENASLISYDMYPYFKRKLHFSALNSINFPH